MPRMCVRVRTAGESEGRASNLTDREPEYLGPLSRPAARARSTSRRGQSIDQRAELRWYRGLAHVNGVLTRLYLHGEPIEKPVPSRAWRADHVGKFEETGGLQHVAQVALIPLGKRFGIQDRGRW